MYNVFLIDDETIILSGIKFLIDWGKNECTIMDTARNGKDALDKIRRCQPDIVLCDIKMPIMNGIELLKLVSREFPSIVFIMLTNLEEFPLAKEAIRYRALEYLVKNQLDAPLLEECLARAREESNRRSQLVQADNLQYYDSVRQQELIQNACLELLFSPEASSLPQAETILSAHRMLDGYGFLYIPLNFTTLPDSSVLNNDSKTTLTAWEKELATRLADNLFGSHYLYVQTGQNDCLTMFLWGQGRLWEQNITLFSSKFSSASGNITQVQPVVCSTPCFFGPEQLPVCRDAYFQCVEHYYLQEDTFTSPLPAGRPAFEPLGLAGIGSQLEAEINSRSLTGALLLLDKAVTRLENTLHQKSQAIWLCNELFRSASRTFIGEGLEARFHPETQSLMTRRQVIRWLENLKNLLIDLMGSQSSQKSAPIEKARQYVLEHVEDHISLQDVAEKVSISPGYLSTLFKKQYDQSFVSFINQAKVDRACTLMRDNPLMISEIAYRLGFENAYYFAKIFRRYTGMTPSEWRRQHGNSAVPDEPSQT